MAAPFPLIADGRGGVGDVVQEPEEAAAQDYAKTSPGFSGFLSGFSRSENPIGSVLFPEAEQSQYKQHSWFRDFMNSMEIAQTGGNFMAPQIEYQPSPQLTAEEANKQYPNPDPTGKPLFNEPLDQNLAQTIAKQKGELYQAQTDVARFQANHGGVTNFAADVVGTFTDPLNVASAFIPGFGEEALAAKLGVGLFGRIATRAAVGAEAGGMQQAFGAALKLGASDDLRTDYSIRDALRETLLGGAAGAGLNVGIGGLVIDPLKYLTGNLSKTDAALARARIEAPAVATADAETNHAAAQSAVSQIVQGKPVDVADFFPKPPAATTETAIGRVLNNPYFDRVEPADLGLDRREVARAIEPKTVREYEALERQKADLSAQMQELNAARSRGDTQANQLTQDQIDQLQGQLSGKLSKAKRATTEQQLADLKEQLGKIPSEADFAGVQQRLQDADNALRDMLPRISPVFQRADETIARATLAETGNRLEDLIQRQNEFMTRDFSGVIDRELGWRKTGVAPGISHDDLVTAIGEVETAAKNAPPPPVPQDRPPESWVNEAKAAVAAETAAGEATGAGKAPEATTAAPKGETPTAAPEGIDLTGMGKGMSDSLYKTIFDALQGAKNAAARMRDPVIERARPAFDKGLIQSPDDLRKLVQAGYDVDKAGLAQATPRPAQSFAEAYPDLDAKTLLPEERAELMAAHNDVENANFREKGYQEAGRCLTEG